MSSFGRVAEFRFRPLADLTHATYRTTMILSFGPDWERELWASPYRLRFELNQGDSYVTMFTSSYDRARVLARAALPTDNLVGVIAAYPDPKREIGAKWRG